MCLNCRSEVAKTDLKGTVFEESHGLVFSFSFLSCRIAEENAYDPGAKVLWRDPRVKFANAFDLLLPLAAAAEKLA